ncbi:MAG: hypothetical protein ABSG53_13935, partial [Thermoguttaceae bacterium]
LTEWLNELADEPEDELDAASDYFAWLAEKRLDFIKQVDVVEAARRLKRVHYLEHAYGVIPRVSTIKPPHSLPNSPEHGVNPRGKSVESLRSPFHVG